MNDELKTKLTPIPFEFKCPISKALMVEPVMATDGHNYERKSIEMQVLVHKNLKSPTTNTKLVLPVFFVNYDLKSQINEFVNNYKEEYEEEYKRLTLEAENWKSERKKHLPNRIIVPNKSNESKIAALFYEKGGAYDEIIDLCRSSEKKVFQFWFWLKEAYEDDSNNTEAFIHAIDTEVMLQTFLAYDEEFTTLSLKYDINTLLLLGPSRLSRWLSIIHKSYTRNEHIILNVELKTLNISLQDIDRWGKDEEDLLADIVAYRYYVESLYEKGNFYTSKSNDVHLPIIEQLKLLKEFSYGFRRKIFKTHWMQFSQLNYKAKAAIPFYKWVNLWKSEKEDSLSKRKIFDDILENSDDFSSVVSNIRKNWFKYECNDQFNVKSALNEEKKSKHEVLKNSVTGNHQHISPQLLNEDFDQHVSIHDLWNLYQKTDKANDLSDLLIGEIFNPKPKFIHGWLIDGKITPKHLIEMLSDQTYKTYYGSYITAYGTEELSLRLLYYQGHVLGQSEELKEFYDKKTKQLFEDGLKKMGMFPKRMQLHVQVTDTHIFLTCENAINFKAMQALLNAKSKSIPNALSFNENSQSLYFEREKANECLKYIRETIENIDKETCKEILKDLKKNKEKPADTPKLKEEPQELELNEGKNNENQLNQGIEIEYEKIAQPEDDSLCKPTKENPPSTVESITDFIKKYKRVLSVATITIGAGLGVYGGYHCITNYKSAHSFDANVGLTILGVSLFLLGIAIAYYCKNTNNSNEFNDEIDYEPLSPTSRSKYVVL